MPKKIVKFIDLFSGMGGIRLGFEQAFHQAGYDTRCVLTAEIKDDQSENYTLAVENIAGMFNVSRQAAEIRLEQLDLLQVA